MFLKEAEPIARFFDSEISKDGLTKMHENFVKNESPIPLGETLFQQWLLAGAVNLYDDLLQGTKEHAEVTGERIVSVIFDHYDSSPYLLVQEIIKNIDRADLARYVDEGLSRHKSQVVVNVEP